MKSLDEIALAQKEVSKPLNVLLPFFPGVRREEFARLGVARLSVGGALEQETMAAFKAMAKGLRMDEVL